MSGLELAALLLLGGVLVATGILAIFLGRRMKNDQLPPNVIFGTRTLYSLESEENWYRVQRGTAVPTMLLGYVAIPAGVIVAIGATVEFFCSDYQVSDNLLLAVLAILSMAAVWFWVPYFRLKRSVRHDQDEDHEGESG